MQTRWTPVFCQAEAGIRDWSVTGVQTCALPISRPTSPASRPVTWGELFATLYHNLGIDRKSVVEGKSVDLGGRRIIKKKNTKARDSGREQHVGCCCRVYGGLTRGVS